MHITRDGHFRILNPEESDTSQTFRNSFCGINQIIGFDFTEKSIILLQTATVCHTCINNAPIMTTHRAIFICVCMRDAAHSHVLPSIFAFQPQQLHLRVLRSWYILTKCCFEVIFSHKFFSLLLQVCC